MFDYCWIWVWFSLTCCDCCFSFVYLFLWCFLVCLFLLILFGLLLFIALVNGVGECCSTFVFIVVFSGCVGYIWMFAVVFWLLVVALIIVLLV